MPKSLLQTGRDILHTGVYYLSLDEYDVALKNFDDVIGLLDNKNYRLRGIYAYEIVKPAYLGKGFVDGVTAEKPDISRLFFIDEYALHAKTLYDAVVEYARTGSQISHYNIGKSFGFLGLKTEALRLLHKPGINKILLHDRDRFQEDISDQKE